VTYVAIEKDSEPVPSMSESMVFGQTLPATGLYRRAFLEPAFISRRAFSDMRLGHSLVCGPVQP